MLLKSVHLGYGEVRNFSIPRQHPCAHSLPLSDMELLLCLLPGGLEPQLGVSTH